MKWEVVEVEDELNIDWSKQVTIHAMSEESAIEEYLEKKHGRKCGEWLVAIRTKYRDDEHELYSVEACSEIVYTATGC